MTFSAHNDTFFRPQVMKIGVVVHDNLLTTNELAEKMDDKQKR